MSGDTLTVKGPYTDNTFAVVSRGPDGRPVGHGFYKSRGLAEEALFRLRDERRGGR